MNKQEAITIISTLKKTCNIPEKSLLLKQQSKIKFEIHIDKSLQENQWLCLEEIISENSLRLKLDGKLMIIF
jgi:hypothetical protein